MHRHAARRGPTHDLIVQFFDLANSPNPGESHHAVIGGASEHGGARCFHLWPTPRDGLEIRMIALDLFDHWRGMRVSRRFHRREENDSPFG